MKWSTANLQLFSTSIWKFSTDFLWIDGKFFPPTSTSMFVQWKWGQAPLWVEKLLTCHHLHSGLSRCKHSNPATVTKHRYFQIPETKIWNSSCVILTTFWIFCIKAHNQKEILIVQRNVRTTFSTQDSLYSRMYGCFTLDTNNICKTGQGYWFVILQNLLQMNILQLWHKTSSTRKCKRRCRRSSRWLNSKIWSSFLTESMITRSIHWHMGRRQVQVNWWTKSSWQIQITSWWAERRHLSVWRARRIFFSTYLQS